MVYQNILYEKQEHVGLITINRPEALNALNSHVVSELFEVFHDMHEDREIHCVVITGKGRAFIAGADIREEDGNDGRDHHLFLRRGHQLMNTIEQFRAPVLAAVNGYALGGGLELAMACDLRIAADTAKMGVPEINLAVIPGFGGTHRLPALVGLPRAKEMMMTGRHVPAAEALSYGLVEQVVPAGELLDTVMKLAKSIAARAPLAIEYGKIAVTQGFWSDPLTSSEVEMGLHCQLHATRDKHEGYTAFLEKRPPKPFIGR